MSREKKLRDKDLARISGGGVTDQPGAPENIGDPSAVTKTDPVANPGPGLPDEFNPTVPPDGNPGDAPVRDR